MVPMNMISLYHYLYYLTCKYVKSFPKLLFIVKLSSIVKTKLLKSENIVNKSNNNYEYLIQIAFEMYSDKHFFDITSVMKELNAKIPDIDKNLILHIKKRLLILHRKGCVVAEFYRQNDDKFTNDWETTKYQMVKYFDNEFPEFTDHQLIEVFCRGLFETR